MGALTAKSDPSSAFSVNPSAQAPSPLTQLPQQGNALQSILMQGLTNYFNGQTATAGNPNATSPSLTSSLAQTTGSTFDNSQMGGLANSMAGNTAGNGYGAQGAALFTAPNTGEGAAGASAGADTAGSSAGADGSSAGGVASIMDSIVCTALYGRSLLPRNIWVCAQRYGRSIPSDTFAGYLLWASPIAKKIRTSGHFAKFASIILLPVVYEMAVSMKEPLIKSTIYGRLGLRAGYMLSFVVGKILRLMATPDAAAETHG